MSNLLAARAQMAVPLGFHIVFAEIGIAMPFVRDVQTCGLKSADA
jgi:cytochrome d ubiquinol oxidase subunit I